MFEFGKPVSYHDAVDWWTKFWWDMFSDFWHIPGATKPQVEDDDIINLDEKIVVVPVHSHLRVVK